MLLIPQIYICLVKHPEVKGKSTITEKLTWKAGTADMDIIIRYAHIEGIYSQIGESLQLTHQIQIPDR